MVEADRQPMSASSKARSQQAARSLESDVAMTKMMRKIVVEKKRTWTWEMDEEYFDEMRVMAKKFMKRSWIGLLYENTLLLMSVVSCLQHIYSSYFDTLTDAKLIRTSDIVELVFASAFAFDWVLSFCLADHKVMFCYR